METSSISPAITLTNGETGEEVAVTATEEGPPGHYVATITLPSEGVWEWRIDPLGRGTFDSQVMSPIRVQVATAAGQPVPEVAPQPGATWAPWMALAAVVVLAGAGAALLQRTRRRAALRP